MEPRFLRPGDRVVVVEAPKFEKYVGLIGRIASEERIIKTLKNKPGYTFHADNGDSGYGTRECFRKLYDGWDKISWDECIWKPKEILDAESKERERLSPIS